MITKYFIVFLTSTLLILVSIDYVESSAVLIADFSMSRMIELSAKRPFCKLHKDRGDIQRMLLSADQRRIRQVPRESVSALENVCRDTLSVSGQLQGGLGFIYPGTKWCGPGTIATDYNDLGRYSDEDRCCRDHDLCPNTLAPGECRRGLCNTGGFTRSHCDCDARFRRCLQSLNTETANTLGAVFFNVVQVTCFRERSPCSFWQRLDTQLNPQICPFIFQDSDWYVPSNDGFIVRLVNESSEWDSIARSLKLDRIYYNPNFQKASTRLSVGIASVGLIAKNLFQETFGGPIQSFLRHFQKSWNYQT